MRKLVQTGHGNVPGTKTDVLQTVQTGKLCVWKTHNFFKRGLSTFSILAILFAAGLCGCNPKDADSLKTDAGKLIKTTGEAAGNAKVAGNVNLILASWKGIHMDRFRVEAQDNVVTLVGTVPTTKEKAEVERVTKQIRGVDKVINNLKVEASK